MVELWFECFEYYPYIQMWQYMLICGVGAKPGTHLMQYHLLQQGVQRCCQLLMGGGGKEEINIIAVDPVSTDMVPCNTH